MKMFKDDGKTMAIESKIDQITASKSKRVMRAERGCKPEFIKDRMFERNKKRADKAKNRYCNNLQQLRG